jgi:PAS domain S-box-containing protein
MFQILYVDDEPDLLELGKVFLEQSHQFNIETRTSAEDALAGGDLLAYDAIISDYQMPGMNGISFLKVIRSRYRDLPFVLFTGRGREEVVIEAIDSGVDFYIQKGGDPRSQFAELEHRVLQAIEVRRGREALRESEERFRSLFTSISNGFAHHQIICDADGRPVDYRFIDVNPAFERLTGLKRDDILGKTVLEVLPETEPFWIERYGRTALTGESQSFENFSAALGKYFEVTAYSPRPGEFTTLFSDVTEQRRAGRVLAEREAHLRTILETLPVGVCIIDRNGGITDSNTMMNRIWGVPDGAFPIATTMEEYVRYNGRWRDTGTALKPEDWAASRALQNGETVIGDLVDIQRFNEEDATISVSAVPLYDRDGSLDGAVAVMQDVSVQQRTETTLREREEQYRTMVETSPDMLWEIDTRGCFTYVSPQIADTLGYPPEEMLGRPVFSLRLPDAVDAVKETFLSHLQNREPMHTFEVSADHADGTPRSIEIRSAKIRNSTGQVTGFRGIARDITEQRRAEERDQANKQQYQDLVENLNDVIFTVDMDGLITFVSPAGEERFGYRPSDLMGRSFQDVVFCEDLPALIRRFGEIRQGIIVPLEWRLVQQDGSLVWVRSSTRPVAYAGGTAGFLGTITDISRERRAEEELRESEASYHGLFNTIRQAIYILDREGRFLDVNDGAVAMYGYPREAFLGKRPEFLSAPGMNDLEAVGETIRTAFTGEPQQLEFWGLRSNGEIFPKEIVFYRGTYFGEEVLIAIAADITERMHTSEASRLSNILLETANRQMDCPALLQKYLQVIQAYAGCEVVGIHLERPGMMPCEAWSGLPGDGGTAGSPLSGIVDRGISAAVVGGITDPTQPFFSSRGSFYINGTTSVQEARRRAGDRTWTLSSQAGFESVALIPLRQGGQVIGLICLADLKEQRVPLARVEVLEAVTPQMLATIQRVTAEDRIRRSLEEKEVLMKEIHHRVKNNLAVIISLIDLQIEDITDDQTLRMLQDLQGRVATMALVHEFLYGSGDLSRINFGQYLQDLVPKLVQSLGGSTPVEVEYRVDPALLPLEIAVPCGLIANELVTNSLKYAFPTGKPASPDGGAACSIIVSFRETGDGFALSIGDNGAGLPDGFDWKTTKTLGLQLVRILACHQLRGQVEHEERDGTWFTIHFPGQ